MSTKKKGFAVDTWPSRPRVKVWIMPSFSEIPLFHHSSVTDINFSKASGAKTAIPEKMDRRCGCNLSTNSVQTPKFDPPPLIPKKRSGFSV